MLPSRVSCSSRIVALTAPDVCACVSQSRVKELEAEAVVRESRIRELHAELQKTKGAAAEGSAAGEQRMRELRREWEDAMRRVNAEQDDLTARNTELEREVQELRSELESAKKRSDYDASKIVRRRYTALLGFVVASDAYAT